MQYEALLPKVIKQQIPQFIHQEHTPLAEMQKLISLERLKLLTQNINGNFGFNGNINLNKNTNYVNNTRNTTANFQASLSEADRLIILKNLAQPKYF